MPSIWGADSDSADDTSEVEQYSIEGRTVRCPHCEGTHFAVSKAQLNTALATLFKLDWANRSATILICDSCGQIQWFNHQPDPVA